MLFNMIICVSSNVSEYTQVLNVVWYSETSTIFSMHKSICIV